MGTPGTFGTPGTLGVLGPADTRWTALPAADWLAVRTGSRWHSGHVPDPGTAPAGNTGPTGADPTIGPAAPTQLPQRSHGSQQSGGSLNQPPQ